MLSKICRLVLHVGALVQATVPRNAKTYWKRDQTFNIDQKRSKNVQSCAFFSVNYNGWLLWCLWIIWMLISAFCVYSEFGVFLVYLHANFDWSLNCLNCITSYPWIAGILSLWKLFFQFRCISLGILALRGYLSGFRGRLTSVARGFHEKWRKNGVCVH